MTESPREQAAGSFGAQLQHLVDTVYPRGRKPYSDQEISEGTGLSKTAVWKLRTNRTRDPGLANIQAIAAFFGVHPAYFFDQRRAAEIDEQLALLAALRDAQVDGLAMRVAGLSPRGRKMVEAIVDQVRALEGIDDAAGES
jgi:transcriptional regulator with XRE-family HTH domain